MTRVRWLQAVAVMRRDSAAAGLQLLVAARAPRSPRACRRRRATRCPQIDTHAKGRPADQLHEWAAERAPALDIPVTALEAYAYAARVAEVENPDCHLAWTTLAGIGMVESHHGTYRGADDRAQRRRHARRSAACSSTAPTATCEILDSDAVSLDGERAGLVRAMGPMQFIPETWRLYGVDANNDGDVSPDNIDDAALSAAGYLCWRGKDLATAAGLDERAARLQPLRPVRPHGAGLGDRLCRRTSALSTPARTDPRL